MTPTKPRLILGKPIGIVAFSWLAVRFGLARLPAGVTWSVLCGAGCLGGIGFTMSLFIANLGLDGELIEAGKVGVLVGSVCSAFIGCAILLLVTKSPRTGPAEESSPGAVLRHAGPAAGSTSAVATSQNVADSPSEDPAEDDVYDFLSCWNSTREFRGRPFGRA
ncbi:MAG TPA: Na+/H+ antiporter NhaA [Pirellulales bacterium]|nr:Na+/H+ antiporter NhaA [Pirellulales bacterium]